jgi:hypothetical protein
MWASWVAPVYTSCVLRGALRFFNEIFLLIKKIYSINSHSIDFTPIPLPLVAYNLPQRNGKRLVIISPSE